MPATASPSSTDVSALRVRAGRWPRLSDAIEAALGGFEHEHLEVIMAQIGSFTRDETGVFTGTIRTLTLNVKATIRPVDRDNDKAPDHRVFAGAVEIGAGWTRAAKESGAEYLSVKLDDPSLPSPIYATLVQGEDGTTKLIWSR